MNKVNVVMSEIVDRVMAEGTQPLSVVPHTLVVDGSCSGDATRWRSATKQQYILIPSGEEAAVRPHM